MLFQKKNTWLTITRNMDQTEVVKKEAHARAMLHKMNQMSDDPEKQRLWRWALRGIVIQWTQRTTQHTKKKKVLVELVTYLTLPFF